ncbi:hypothetical protein [Clostridium grantii]|uniref:RES domain-containing protein n=1 Tax=Clostridium grantii DSM 8605 TaxID=1121316 RepID=A0A1M5RCL6_9CLOT|nr:hypothetical protein [Clostridium grantii]SHH24077.1 hypothetical protein SAMN02745207_00459 [Clostridium grantii DSM 8605]
MECIVEFLHDNYHSKLRNLCQIQSDKYEEALVRYKDTFLSELNLMKRCKKACRRNDNKKIENIHEFINMINEEEVSNFFDEIINIYICWIDSRGDQALENFITLLDKFHLLDFQVDISNEIFFRARQSKGILTPWDMFHIPFNRRYLISNQRYSLTGQPLVYLGMSVLDVLSELNSNLNEFEEVKIATYVFKDSFMVYDLRNDFYKYIKHNLLTEIVEDFTDDFNMEFEQFKNEFFKFILSSICSFEKRKELDSFTFCEEYVIPQLLAQILKKKQFKGVIYSSTKLKEKENDEKYNTKYKDNIAVFTNFNKEHVYDRELFNKLKISNPISLNKSGSINVGDVKYICDKIKSIDIDKRKRKYYNTGLELEQDFTKIKIQGKEYFEHDIGKLHLYLVYILLFEVRNKCLTGGE